MVLIDRERPRTRSTLSPAAQTRSPHVRSTPLRPNKRPPPVLGRGLGVWRRPANLPCRRRRRNPVDHQVRRTPPCARTRGEERRARLSRTAKDHEKETWGKGTCGKETRGKETRGKETWGKEIRGKETRGKEHDGGKIRGRERKSEASPAGSRRFECVGVSPFVPYHSSPSRSSRFFLFSLLPRLASSSRFLFSPPSSCFFSLFLLLLASPRSSRFFFSLLFLSSDTFVPRSDEWVVTAAGSSGSLLAGSQLARL